MRKTLTTIKELLFSDSYCCYTFFIQGFERKNLQCIYVYGCMEILRLFQNFDFVLITEILTHAPIEMKKKS